MQCFDVSGWAVELGADVLPSHADQDPAFEIDHRHGNASELVELVHERLERRRVDDVGELQVPDVSFWREDAVQLQPDALLARPERLLRAPLRGDVPEHEHDPEDLAVAAADRSGAVGDGDLGSIRLTSAT